MKRRSELKRKTELRRYTGLRPTEGSPSTQQPAKGAAKGRGIRRPISPASSAQRAKVRDACCIVTGRDRHDGATIDPMHLCPRSHGGCDDPLCVVPGEREWVHRRFDDGKFDLLPHLRPSGAERQWLPEIQHALDHYDGDLISLS
jgi:hypothetical protein